MAEGDKASPPNYEDIFATDQEAVDNGIDYGDGDGGPSDTTDLFLPEFFPEHGLPSDQDPDLTGELVLPSGDQEDLFGAEPESPQRGGAVSEDQVVSVNTWIVVTTL